MVNAETRNSDNKGTVPKGLLWAPAPARLTPLGHPHLPDCSSAEVAIEVLPRILSGGGSRAPRMDFVFRICESDLAGHADKLSFLKNQIRLRCLTLAKRAMGPGAGPSNPGERRRKTG